MSAPPISSQAATPARSKAVVTTPTGVFVIYDAQMIGPERIIGHLADGTAYRYELADGDQVRLGVER